MAMATNEIRALVMQQSEYAGDRSCNTAELLVEVQVKISGYLFLRPLRNRKIIRNGVFGKL